MPSPFPGMDPFIEGQIWQDFHDSLIPDLRDALNWSLPGRYTAYIQDRVTLTDASGDGGWAVVGDASVRDRGDAGDTPATAAVTASPGVATLTLTLPAVESDEEIYVEVREGDTGRLVTVIEVLSPKNKRGDGRVAYLEKRAALLRTEVNLVELDLLRGGRRPPTVEPLPDSDYFAFVSRADERPTVAVTHWRLSDPLPNVPVPLRPGDREVTLPLQRIFGRMYDAANYARVLRYDRPPSPPLPPDGAAWAAERLAAAGVRG